MEKSLSLHEPIQSTSVFSYLVFNPDEIAKLSSKRRVLERESSEPSRIILVSSAYCESLYSTLAILMPRAAANIFILPNEQS